MNCQQRTAVRASRPLTDEASAFSRHGGLLIKPSLWETGAECTEDFRVGGGAKPDGAGQLEFVRYASAAASRASAGSPRAWAKSSATEQPDTGVPATPTVLLGEKPSV